MRAFGIVTVIIGTLFLGGFHSTVLSQDTSGKQDDAKSATNQDSESLPTISGKSLTEKSSYLLGHNFLAGFKAQGIDIDIDRMIAGLKDAAADKEPPMSTEEIRAVETAFQRMVMEKQRESFKLAADKNLREGEAFLKENAMKDGVKELESGLQFKIVTAGTGKVPQTGDQIKFHFKGSFPDGTTFESSGDKPIQYRMGGQIMPAMAEAFSRMKEGDKWLVYIPSKLAFGIQGNPPKIGPNQTLVYELELLEIVK